MYKVAITVENDPGMIGKLLAIPQIRSAIEQHAAGFVDKIVVTPGGDIQQTQQRLNTDPNAPNVKLPQQSGNPVGHMYTYQDPTTHQHKALDKIVRIDRVTDEWGTLVTIMHEIAHHRHPDWSESQVESEAEKLAGNVKQYLPGQKTASLKDKSIVMFCKQKLDTLPIVSCDVARTVQQQVVGLQNHTSLKPNSGMVFIYASSGPLTFWMGTVKFPIDIVFADASNKILKIYHNCQPNSQDTFGCQNAAKVIEVVGNYCAMHNIQEGDQIHLSDDVAPASKEKFIKFVLQNVLKFKQECQKELNMELWSIKVVMEGSHDSKKFMRVNWDEEDYAIMKAKIIVNPDPQMMEQFFAQTGFDLKEAVKHALIHIKVGIKNELSKDKEKILINRYMYSKHTDKKVVFDVDETLLHCFSPYGGKPFSKDNADFTFTINDEPFWGKVRPGITDLLNSLAQQFPLFIFSAAPKEYVDAALAASGLREYFERIFSQENLELNEKDEDVKNLALIDQNLDHVVAVDNNLKHYPDELADRAIHIIPYYGKLIDDNLGDVERQIYEKLSINKAE